MLRHVEQRDGGTLEEQFFGKVQRLLEFVADPHMPIAAAAVAALYQCVQDAAANAELQEPLGHVLRGMLRAGERLGEALRRPGFVAAAAAWDPKAVPALCILAVASHAAYPNDSGGDRDRTHLHLQPAVVSCLRFLSDGGSVPLLTAEAAALYAAQLARTCYQAGRQPGSDEATLVRLLHHCSRALSADVTSAAVPTAPDAAAAAGTAKVLPEHAAQAAADLAADDSVACADTAGRRPAAPAAQSSSSAGSLGSVSPGQPDVRQPVDQLGAHRPQRLPQLRGDEPQPEWESMWAPPVATAMQALMFMKPKRAPEDASTGGANLPVASRVATAALVAAGQALLAHEAPLQRGSSISSLKVLETLVDVLRMAEVTSDQRHALVSSLVGAVHDVLHTLPAEGSGAVPTACQAMALSRLASVVHWAAGCTSRSYYRGQEGTLRDELAAATAAALSAAARWARKLETSGAADPCSGTGTSECSNGSRPTGASTQQQPPQLSPQQQQQQQQPPQQRRQRCMKQAAFELSQAAEQLLWRPPNTAAGLEALERGPVLRLLASLATHCRIDATSLQRHVQACAEEEEEEEAAVLMDFMADLMRAAAALEAAVGTVAAAAEHTKRRQPSPELVAACFEAARSALGVTMLKFGALRNLPPRVTSAHREVLLELQRRAELALRMVRACGHPAACMGRTMTNFLLMVATTVSHLQPLPAPAVQPLLAILRALAAYLQPPRCGALQQPGDTPTTPDVFCHWAEVVKNITLELEGKTSAARQSLITRGLQEVSDALGALWDAALAARRAAAAASCGGAAAVPARTQATADAAMRELLAAEEGEKAAAAVPSRAAERRARKKAATRAAAAAAVAAAAAAAAADAAAADPEPAAELPQHSQTSSTAAAGAPPRSGTLATDAAAELECVSPADGAAVEADLSGLNLTVQHDGCDTNPVQRQQQQQPPAWMLCPITKEVLLRATLCVGDGHSYEESAISRWLQTHDTSPVTGEVLTTNVLLPNHALRQLIQAVGRQ